MKTLKKAFDQKVIFITGASAGIGYALTEELARHGAHFILFARREERLQSLANRLKTDGNRVIIFKGDVTREADLKLAIQKGIQEFGKIDTVIANAGFGVSGNLNRLTIEDYQRQFDTNVFGVLRTIYATLDELKKSKGTLVLLGSVAGLAALPGNSPYSMSKFAIHALAQSLTDELKHFGVSTILIAPGFVKSEIRNVDNFGNFHAEANDPVPAWLRMPTEKAAQKIARAISKKKRMEVITFHGKVIAQVARFFPRLIRTVARLSFDYSRR